MGGFGKARAPVGERVRKNAMERREGGKGISKDAPHKKMNKIMKKGKLPAFTFNATSIFNRSAAASKSAQPPCVGKAAAKHAASSSSSKTEEAERDARQGEGVKQTHNAGSKEARATGVKNKENTRGNVSAHAPKQLLVLKHNNKTVVVNRPLRPVGRAAGACEAGGDKAEEQARPQQQPLATLAHSSTTLVPKGASLTTKTVAAPVASRRRSSEEVFLPAGLPCFVT